MGNAPHIARIGQHLGHRGLSNAGNAVEQLGITLQIGVAINVGVNVAFKVVNLLPRQSRCVCTDLTSSSCPLA